MEQIKLFDNWLLFKMDEVAKLRNMSSEEHTRSIFAWHGIPEMVILTDNGLQFACDTYAKFAHEYGFNHITSSPH